MTHHDQVLITHTREFKNCARVWEYNDRVNLYARQTDQEFYKCNKGKTVSSRIHQGSISVQKKPRLLITIYVQDSMWVTFCGCATSCVSKIHSQAEECLCSFLVEMDTILVLIEMWFLSGDMFARLACLHNPCCQVTQAWADFDVCRFWPGACRWQMYAPKIINGSYMAPSLWFLNIPCPSMLDNLLFTSLDILQSMGKFPLRWLSHFCLHLECVGLQKHELCTFPFRTHCNVQGFCASEVCVVVWFQWHI